MCKKKKSFEIGKLVLGFLMDHLMFWKWNVLWMSLLPTIVLADNLALLSGTLRLYQKAACDEEWVSLKCPTGTTISIQLAQYGKTAPGPTLCLSNPSIHPDLMDVVDPTNNFNCQWPAAVQTVVGLCQKKASCKFQTSPRTFGGDPCPGIRKFVEVVYKCRPSEFRSVTGCEDEVIQLNCTKNSRLAIYSANYGRTEYESVQCPQPNGVHEETCLSSYATETVMQMCHGKRRCALGADQATFGSPCKPESRMYLKVIHTCVPRKVLKEKYQGEPEPDEMFEEESEDESGDPIGGVLEQPSIYSPDHSKNWPNTNSNNNNNINNNQLATTEGTLIASSSPKSSEASGSGARGGIEEGYGKSEPVLNLNAQTESDSESGTKGNLSSQNAHDVRIIYLISQGIHAYDFISKNSDKFYLYLAISTTSVLLLMVLVILVRICVQRRRQRRVESSTSSKNKKGHPSTSSATGPLVPSSGMSDIDELSIIAEPNEYIDLPSILRRPPEEMSLPFASTTLGRNGNGRNPDCQVVRFSNSRVAALSRQESDTNPRSFNRELENVHFYYG